MIDYRTLIEYNKIFNHENLTGFVSLNQNIKILKKNQLRFIRLRRRT